MTNQESLTLPVYYIGQIQEEVIASGFDGNEWLQQCGLSEAIVKDLSATIRFADFATLINDAIRITGKSALGLYVGKRLGVTTHGMLGYAIMSSGSLREVLALLQRFVITRSPLVETQVEEREEVCQVLLHQRIALGDIEQPFLEAILLTFCNVLRQVFFESIPINRVFFPYPEPEYVSLYESYFACPVSFNATTAGLEVPTVLLDKPLKMADPSSLEQAKRLCEQELEKLHVADTLSYRIKKYILACANQFPTLQQVADEFHMSPRTLHRHLKSEQTSFKQVVEQVRHSLAKEYLHKSDMNIQEIAYLLGYTDMANFRRAFKRWQGVAPSDYRNGVTK